MAGLWVGQALGCSTYLGLGSAVPAPMFMGMHPNSICDLIIIIIIIIIIIFIY